MDLKQTQERVWKRVLESRSPEGPDDGEVLLGLMRGAEGARLRFCRMSSWGNGPVLLSLADREARHLCRLRALYFLQTGEQPRQRLQVPREKGTYGWYLRRACVCAGEQIRALEAAAVRWPLHRPLFAALCREEVETVGTLRCLTEGLLRRGTGGRIF